MEKELPKGWVETEIDNLFYLVYGKGLLTKDLIDDGYDVYGANGVIGKYSKYLYKDSKVIISCRGAGCGIIHRTKPFAFVTSNSIVFDEISANYINLDFIKYALETIDKDDVITGTAQPQITIQLLKNLQIPFPPLPEQQRIVAKLDTLFGKLDKIKTHLERIPQLLKDFRQKVLTQAVTGNLTEEWREGKEMDEWEESTIGKLFEVKTGATPNRGVSKYYENANIPWIKSGLVKNEFIYEADEFISEIALIETNTKVFPKDTLLVAMYGEGKTRGQVGWMKIDAATNQAIAALVNETMHIITRTYVFLFCLSQYNEIRSKAEGGNQPNLNLSKIKNWEIDIPPTEEQQEIVRRVESLFAKADKIEASYQKLKEQIEQLPQAILAKAFRGELVEQLPTDGDARELLEEIRKMKGGLEKGGRSRKIKEEESIKLVAEPGEVWEVSNLFQKH